MKRSIVLLTVTAVLMATLMLMLSIVSAGAVPVQETAAGPVQLLVNIRYDYAYVRSDPNLPAQITVKDSSGTVKATVSGTTNEIGTFGSWHGTWTPEHPDIEPGDKVMGDVDGTTADIDPVGQISGKLDLDADTIEGTVTAPWFAPATIEVKCVTWSDTENGPEITVSGINPDGGSFVCDYGSLPWDMTGDWYYEISYIEPDGDEVQSEPILPWVRVNYGS